MSVDPEPEATGQPPLRCLDDEQVHLQRPGTLRLTDFEVKGTLGASELRTSAGATIEFEIRHWHVWPSPACTTPGTSV